MKQQLPSTFNHYYKFCRKPSDKNKTRLDCTNSTGSYIPLESKRATKPVKATKRYEPTNVGDLVIYLGLPDNHIKAHNKRQADRSITIKAENLTSVYLQHNFEDGSWIAYGDVKGTSDAIIMLYNITEVNGYIQEGSYIEMFIACGKADECRAICNLFADGEIDEEIEWLRQNSKPFNPDDEKPEC
ncbi:MAG: hypothetical protein LIP09_07380 [Bacteroidales bacterium]|nr:hypothetical protein [Bacteroidales bacterium]